MKYAMILYGSVLAAISFRKTALKFEPIKGLRILILIMQALLAHQITIPSGRTRYTLTRIYMVNSMNYSF